MKANTLTQIEPDRTYIPLMLGIVVQAVRDAQSYDLVRAIDGTMFLFGEDFALWSEALGYPDADPEKLLLIPEISLERYFETFEKRSKG